MTRLSNHQRQLVAATGALALAAYAIGHRWAKGRAVRRHLRVVLTDDSLVEVLAWFEREPAAPDTPEEEA